MTSYLWRNTAGDENATTKIGTRTAAGSALITFTATNTTNGKHLHQSEFEMVVAIGDNEKPQGNVNELQDVGVDSATWVITGSIESPITNSVQQLVKEWMFDGKTDAVYTKGRFGLEMDDLTSYNCNPTGTGSATEQPRGYILSNWKWIKDGETSGKVSFIATLRFNGDPGTSGNSYSWIVNH
jgi:hypothetical protein